MQGQSQTAKKVLEKSVLTRWFHLKYEMGQSLAQTILFHNNVDVFQLDKNVSIVEMKIPGVFGQVKAWAS